jgi:hypothetical protein
MLSLCSFNNIGETETRLTVFESDVTRGMPARISSSQISGIDGESAVLPAGNPQLLKDIQGLVELCITSASKSFWINVYENVRLHT